MPKDAAQSGVGARGVLYGILPPLAAAALQTRERGNTQPKKWGNVCAVL